MTRPALPPAVDREAIARAAWSVYEDEHTYDEAVRGRDKETTEGRNHIAATDYVHEIADAILQAIAPAPVWRDNEALQEIINQVFTTYTAKNGRQVGIEDDEGERVWLLPNDAYTALCAMATPAPVTQSGEQPVSSADHHQAMGRDRDIINEAISEYDAWMLDDDYEAGPVLQKIISRMKERLSYSQASEPAGEQPGQGVREHVLVAKNNQGEVSVMLDINDSSLSTVLEALTMWEPDFVRLSILPRDTALRALSKGGE